MAGKIHRYDCYDLRKFKPNDIMTFVDVGANKGTTSIMARILFPKARIVAFEPAPDTFEELSFFKNWFIECYQLALGDGSKLSYDKYKHSGLSRFYNEEEKKWWKQDEILIESLPLNVIFEKYKIDTTKPYIVKVDCEGGERFLLKDDKSIDLIRGAVQSMFEIHVGFGGTKEEWREWFKIFEDTHELRIGSWDKSEEEKKRIFIPVSEFDSDKRPEVELVSKQWHYKI